MRLPTASILPILMLAATPAMAVEHRDPLESDTFFMIANLYGTSAAWQDLCGVDYGILREALLGELAQMEVDLFKAGDMLDAAFDRQAALVRSNSGGQCNVSAMSANYDDLVFRYNDREAFSGAIEDGLLSQLHKIATTVSEQQLAVSALPVVVAPQHDEYDVSATGYWESIGRSYGDVAAAYHFCGRANEIEALRQHVVGQASHIEFFNATAAGQVLDRLYVEYGYPRAMDRKMREDDVCKTMDYNEQGLTGALARTVPALEDLSYTYSLNANPQRRH